METQTDGIDISQLRAFALGLNNDMSQIRDPSPVAAASTQQRHGQEGLTVLGNIATEKRAVHDAQPQDSTHSQQWSTSQPHSRRSHSREKATRLSASQPELPSTIPESVRTRMLVNGSQSEGDTQPVSQWVYEQFTNKAKEQHTVEETLSRDGGTLPAAKEPMHRIQPGETGHVDLLGAFEERSVVNAEYLAADQDEDDIDPLSQPMDIRADVFPESRRFKEPDTPATHSKKRKRGSEPNSQNIETPKLPTNPFAGQMGSIDGLMDPSQLFKATQALTSPMIITSDGLSERPSPDIHNLQRPSTADSLSSPVRMPQAGMTRALTEPQTTYVSMQASQEAREKLRQAQILSADEVSDDGFGSVGTQVRRHLNQRKLEIEARKQFEGLSARSQPARRRRGGRISTTPSRVSPRRVGIEASEPVLISDDGPEEEEEQANVTGDETELEEEVDVESDDEADELGDENKENVEVPRTVSRAQHAISQVVASQPSPSHRLSRKLKLSSQNKGAMPASSSPRITRSQETIRLVQTATQPDAIADSQPSQSLAKKFIGSREIRAFSEPGSSLENRVLVPHSQSSDNSKVFRASGSFSKLPPARAFSQTQPSPSPRRSAIQQKVTADNATQVEEATDVGSAAVKAAQKEGANTRSQASEGANPVRESNTSSDPHGSRIYTTDVSTPHLALSLSRSTVADTTSLTAHRHYTRASMAEPSNSMPSPRSTPKSVSKQPSIHPVAEQSRPSTLFETAQEHLPLSPARATLQEPQRHPQSRQGSPTNSKRPRSISEIAADPSPPDPLGDIDVDINILSNEDIEFQNALGRSSPIVPARKRRRGGQGLALQEAEPKAKIAQQLPSTPLPPGSSAMSRLTPIQTSSETDPKSPMTTRIRALRNDQAIAPSPDPSEKFMQRTELASTEKTAPAQTQENRSKPQAKLHRRLDTTIPSSSVAPLSGQDNQGDIDSSMTIAPNRVFAHFNGTSSAYHPATCLEVNGGENPRYTVRFDDGTVDTIGAYGIKRLHLRAGDIVKVDLPGARTKNYVVEGMRDQHHPAIPPDPATPSRRGCAASTNDAAFPETDTHGFATVLVAPKQRASLDANPGDDEQIAVPLTQIYFTQTLWTSFRDRLYNHTINRPQTSTGLQTPSERPSTPSTPSSRTRRIKTSGLALSRSVTSSTLARDGIFKNMAFAITNIDRAEDSERVKNHISSNGGIFLETGLDELFHIPPLPRTTSPKDPEETSFQLTSAAHNVGFTCLIADKHCRRAKFIQALALGIPCLATRWILDCVSKQRITPWAPYLLPAGDSAYLGGVVRSRVLQPFLADTATLSTIIESRPKMLDGASILLIMEKGQEEKMKQHPLITHALGARRVARAISQESAARAVNDAHALGEPWDWVFSYDREDQVERHLFGNSGVTGKKRERGRESQAFEGSAKRAKGGTKVVGNEFMIQSLILGMLVDE